MKKNDNTSKAGRKNASQPKLQEKVTASSNFSFSSALGLDQDVFTSSEGLPLDLLLEALMLGLLMMMAINGATFEELVDLLLETMPDDQTTEDEPEDEFNLEDWLCSLSDDELDTLWEVLCGEA